MPTVRLLLVAACAAAVASALPDRLLARSQLLAVDRFEMRVGEGDVATLVTLTEIPPDAAMVTLRATVELTSDLRRADHPLGIYVAALASHEVWWDGALVGRGGVIGRSAAEERPGPVEAHYQVPDALAAPGPHALLIRASSFHRHFVARVGYWQVVVGDYETIVRFRQSSAWLAAAALSGLVLTAFFALAMFVATRERAPLVLGSLALTAAGLLLVEAWRPVFGYTYDHHLARLVGILVLTWLTDVQLLALVVTRYRQPGGHRLFVAIAVGSLIAAFALPSWDGKVLAVHALGFGAAVLWTLGARIRRLPGSGPALIGLAVACVALVLQPFHFVDYLVFFCLDFLFICLLWSHAREVGLLRQARLTAELASTRLELEMVRRQIQPHFLMNTLTALAEWVETEPRTALRMIDSIAEELRLLCDLSVETLVRIDQELRLCRSHIATMSLRRDVRYELAVAGVRGDEPMPPAVLHTLVENAVTHGLVSPLVTLRLHGIAEGDRMRYVFESPAAAGRPTAPPGTGTRYVEARLRQAWGEDWSLRQEQRGGTWRVELSVPGRGTA